MTAFVTTALEMNGAVLAGNVLNSKNGLLIVLKN